MEYRPQWGLQRFGQGPPELPHPQLFQMPPSLQVCKEAPQGVREADRHVQKMDRGTAVTSQGWHGQFWSSRGAPECSPLSSSWTSPNSGLLPLLSNLGETPSPHALHLSVLLNHHPKFQDARDHSERGLPWPNTAAHPLPSPKPGHQLLCTPPPNLVSSGFLLALSDCLPHSVQSPPQSQDPSLHLLPTLISRHPQLPLLSLPPGTRPSS